MVQGENILSITALGPAVTSSVDKDKSLGRAGATFRPVAAYCWHPRFVAGVPWL